MAVTTVVNLKFEEYDVYIGREGKGQSGYFGNPYKSGDKEDNIKLFRKYFYDRLKNDPHFTKRVHQLQGKKLGCFCKPKLCHGDIIADYLNNLPEIKPVKLAVVGSRSFSDYEFMKSILAWHDCWQIISGGASGADRLAKRYAAEHGKEYVEFLPQWNRYGRSAGYKRNVQIVNAAEEVVAFHDGKSKGTQHTIDIAEEYNKPIYVYKFEKKPENSNDDISTWG